jgi:hypothetical protein
MVIVPYTRRSWRLKGAFFFIVTAWWIQSWAWYSITGLLLADMASNMDFKAKAQRGIKVNYLTLHFLLCALIVCCRSIDPFASLLTSPIQLYLPQGSFCSTFGRQGTQTTALRRLSSSLKHAMTTTLYYWACVFSLRRQICYSGHWQTHCSSILVDDLLVSIHKPTHYTTNDDTGFFLVQSIVFYTLGIKLYQALHLANDMAAVAVCFFVTLAASAAGAEIFYRLVDIPSHVLSHVAFDWIRE